MKHIFKGYYAPTKGDYKKLWDNGLIVLDTNVLLDLYRLPASARDELLAVLSALSSRLWIPYQVALEFQRRRLTVIATERKATEDALSEANDLFAEIKKRVASLQIDKRGLGIEPGPLIDELKSANDKLIQAIDAVHKSQLDIASSDPIRDKLDTLLSNCIGPAPSDQTELDALCIDGELRFDNRIPPGFEDAAKDKNPNEATFYHDGICYQRKFGDLIFWRQIVGHAKKNGVKSVLLVTSERKEDWWWREKGKTIGPRPELAREIAKAGGVELFWMYSSSRFLENARDFTKEKVSDQSVNQLERVARLAVSAEVIPDRRDIGQYLERNRSPMLFNISRYENIVRDWLVTKFNHVIQSGEFPDFIVHKDYGPHGYDVKCARSFLRMLFSPAVVNAVLRGYLEVNEGRLFRFSLILVTDKEEWDSIREPGILGQLDERLDRLLRKYPAYEIIVGVVDDETFQEVHRRRGRGAASVWHDEA